MSRQRTTIRRWGVMAVLSAAILLGAQAAGAGRITEVSIPPNSMDSGCYPVWDNTWTVAAPPYPLDVATGIGWLVNDAPPGNAQFALHDHVYAEAHVPAPARAVVTYRFDAATAVDQVHMTQHHNGIWKIDGYVGDSPSALAYIGTATAPQVTSEYESSTFDFDNTTSGTYFRFVITGTDLSDGYACYRAYPADADGQRFEPIPEPASPALLGLGGARSAEAAPPLRAACEREHHPKASPARFGGASSCAGRIGFGAAAGPRGRRRAAV